MVSQGITKTLQSCLFCFGVLAKGKKKKSHCMLSFHAEITSEMKSDQGIVNIATLTSALIS